MQQHHIFFIKVPPRAFAERDLLPPYEADISLPFYDTGIWQIISACISGYIKSAAEIRSEAEGTAYLYPSLQIRLRTAPGSLPGTDPGSLRLLG